MVLVAGVNGSHSVYTNGKQKPERKAIQTNLQHILPGSTHRSQPYTQCRES